jgi:hypothetical protein
MLAERACRALSEPLVDAAGVEDVAASQLPELDPLRVVSEADAARVLGKESLFPIRFPKIKKKQEEKPPRS